MKKIILSLILAITILTLLTNCATQRATTLVGGEYNEAKDVTEYFVFPYGQTVLPGKWEKCGYNKSSRQQFFRNQDSVIVAIAFGRAEDYEFNQNGALKGNDFVKSFYDWESKYFEAEGLKSQLIEHDMERHYVIFKIYGKKINSHLLVGEKNGFVRNFSVHITSKWSENQKIDFLKTLFVKD